MALLRLGLARHVGAVIAAQFWTVENGVAYIHKLAHRESAKPLSAGTTLSAALFEREYHTLAQITHPGVIRVFDYGVALGT